MKCQDTYKEVKIIHHHNGISKVYVPELTEEERVRRMKRIHDAAADLLRCQERVEAEKKCETERKTAGAGPPKQSLQETG